MSDFFADAGAWFDQAGKDTGEWIDQAVQDTGDILTGISKAPDNDPVSELSENDLVSKEQFSDRRMRYGGTYDPLTNPNPGLESSAFEFSQVEFDSRLIERMRAVVSSEDCRTIEALQGIVASGELDSRYPQFIEALFEGLAQEGCPAF